MNPKVIDSHTEGEPTRVLVDGAPDLGAGGMAARAARFRESHDHLRRAVCCEPRGHDAMVGALLCAPDDPANECGAIFFNNVGTLNMCIHATIGVVATLAHLGRIGPGVHGIESPVSVVRAELDDEGSVTVANVPSYRLWKDVALEVPGWGPVRGDVAWGGNWFFLVEAGGPALGDADIGALTRFSLAVRGALVAGGVTGADGMEIDHIELCGPPADAAREDGRNFVLCPGGAYDRSPCGTGTSAKLACLHADGRLEPGAVWRQAGVLGTVFEGRVEPLEDGRVLPRVRGRAWITGESAYHFQSDDPFQYGIPSSKTRATS